MNAHRRSHAGVDISEERRRDDELEAEASDPAVGAVASAGNASAQTPDQNGPEKSPWAAITPWQGKAAPLDKLLLFVILGMPVIYLALLPLRPWMLVNAPVVQEFINGAKTAIVAAGAYARVGEIPLWLVVVAGFVGMAKLDWAFWLAGRRWADGVLRLFAQDERQLARIERLRRIPQWALFLVTVVARFPGVPHPLVYIVAGWNRMRLPLFLVANLLGCLIFTLIWAMLGYQLGQAAVDVLAVIDKYSIWLTVAIVVGIFALAFVKENRKKKGSSADSEPARS